MAASARDTQLQLVQQQLQATLHGRCDFSAAAIALYTSDASNYRQIPFGAVYPTCSEDIKHVIATCREHNVPALLRGGGTSQNGQCVNNAIIIDLSQNMSNVLALDVENRTATIEPGIVCDALKAEAEQHGLTFGPDPATHSRCTLGGMIGNNSCGPHSMLAGKTVENVLELEILTSDGECFWVGPTSDAELQRIIGKGDRQSEIYLQLKALVDTHAHDIREKFPTIKRRVSGYNLDQLLPENNFNVARALVGTEGTCVTVLQAKVQLIEAPKHVQLLVLGFDNIFLAGDAVADILPFEPIAMEGLDWNIVGGLNDRNLQQREVGLLPEGRAWLLIEIAAPEVSQLEDRVAQFESAMRANELVRSVYLVKDKTQETDLWRIREQGASANAMSLNPSDPDPVVGWEDTAVDPLQLGDYLRALYKLVDRYGYKTSLYGHFGDGCIHARMTFDTRTEEGVIKWREFSKEIADLVVHFGGSLSGEHGDGQAKAEFLPAMFGDKLVRAFEDFKDIWDPLGLMNPRKVVRPYKMDENLRYGPDYNTPQLTSTLQFINDVGGIGRASERCIGMGKCRAATGAMCPSYQVTHEERYSTRGRAHLLHELMRGDIIHDGWHNTDIADSLEHCLSCKACKSSCPTKVDIAAYKSEFMQRHFDGKRRPLHHYIFGLLGRWLPRASKVSWLANMFSKWPISPIANRTLALRSGARLPTMASQSFAQWIQKNASNQDDHFYWVGDNTHKPVVLWSDTINTYLSPHILQSAVRVLNQSGFLVAVSKMHFCCGRPLYEYGFLDKAQEHTQSILDAFYPSLPTDSAVVVLEPSCLSVFKDELLMLHPENINATALASKCVSLIQFLITQGIKPANKLERGLLHSHCHDKSLGIASEETTWIKSCFTELVEPEDGCCGMAGTFGLQKKTSHIGDSLFSRKLKPAIEQHGADTVIVSNGYSCRTQMRNAVKTDVLHSVQLVEKCL